MQVAMRTFRLAGGADDKCHVGELRFGRAVERFGDVCNVHDLDRQ